jgi:hypothetical protein
MALIFLSGLSGLSQWFFSLAAFFFTASQLNEFYIYTLRIRQLLT